MSNEIVRHDYNGSAIPQRVEDGYVSLTAMAQAEGKRVSNYLRLASTKEYLDALKADAHIGASALIQVFKGGDGIQGTWAHPDIAIDFAQWVSPKFRIWANRTLRQTIQSGTVETHISQLLPGLVLPEAQHWSERFHPEWRSEAMRLTGWNWGDRCMSRFINRTVYEWFPQAVRDELDRVNPSIQGNRRNRQHQHLSGEAAEILDKQIDRTYHLMIASATLPHFEQALDQAMTRRYQLSLKIA
jgi:hypothetical protein